MGGLSIGQLYQDRRDSSGVMQRFPIETIGLSSYSIYLWHWPCFVAIKMLHLDSQFGWVVGAILLSFMLGYASYRLVEIPARRWLQSLTWRGTARASMGWLALVGCSVIIVKLDGLPERSPALVNELDGLKHAEVDSTFPAKCVNWKVGNNLELCHLHPTSHIPHPTSHIPHPTSHIPHPTSHSKGLACNRRFSCPELLALLQ